MTLTGPPFRFIRGLRFRLTLSYVLFFAALLVGLGIVLRATLANIFEQQTENVLEEEWAAVKGGGYLRFDKVGPDWFYDPYDPEEARIVERLRSVYLLTDSQGHPLQYSAIYPSLGFDSPAQIKQVIESNGKLISHRVDSHGNPYVIRSGFFVGPNHNKYYLAIGRAVGDNVKVLREFTWKYFSIVSGVIVLSGLLGWYAAGRALSPMNSVAETAQRITHSNLNMQIPARGAGDELDRLIEAFNRMMERLAFSFEQIRQFSTDVSHELRTPLTVIRGQLEVALFTAKTPEQYREAMINALEDVERLSNVVRALLMLSQAESGQLALKKTDLDLAELARDLVEQFQIPAEADGVTLLAELPETCPLLADRVQMERLISNLVSNAIKYTKRGGWVRLSLERRENEARLVVEDNGVGIAPDHLPHIFDRFYRVPSADPDKGLGLGLSFVAWIVKAHGGTIDVESELDKGSRFIVSLPAPELALAPREKPVLAASEQLR